MTYRFYSQSNDTLHMTERHSRSQISYISKQKMDELYPYGGYEIIGEIGNFAKKFAGQDVILTDTDKLIPIFPRGSLKNPFEWVAGYAAVGESTYVAVVKSIIPGHSGRKASFLDKPSDWINNSTAWLAAKAKFDNTKVDASTTFVMINPFRDIYSIIDIN